MQIQELKKALLAKKRALDAAQQRIAELEQQLKEALADSQATPSDEIPTEGVFEDIRYPMLLARCRGHLFTGSVKMQLGGETTRTIYIKSGLPVGFATSEPGEKIGKVLVQQGRITDEQYVKAATRMVEKGIKLSEALVDLGLIEAEMLEIEIRNLTRDQIIQGFGQTQGRFSVKDGEEPDPAVPTFEFGPGEIYVQGYRLYAQKSEMNALYEQLRPKYLTANAKLASFRPKLGLTGDDERLLRLLGEAYTVEEAVERAGIDPDDAARLIAALQALDLVEEWSPGVEQFLARLQSERQHFAEQIAHYRQESAEREQRLFKNFEAALAKISAATGNPLSLTDADADGLPPDDSAALSSARAGAKSSPASFQGKTGAGEKIAVGPAASPPPDTSQEFTPAVGADRPKNGEANVTLIEPGALKAPKNPAEAKFHEAVQMAGDGRLDEAEDTLREAVRMDPARADFLLALARVLLANPKYERAGTLPVVRSLLDRATQLAPDDEEVGGLHQSIVAEMGG